MSNKNNRTRKNRTNTKKYTPVNYSYLLGKVKGIDDKLLKIHFKLYEGLVDSTNDVLQYIHNCSINGVKNMVEYRGVQKELAFFFDGMRLHELYFGIMGGENMSKMDPTLVNDMNKNFGSFAKWKANFIETGRIQGVGFVALCRDRSNGLLFNNWINEYDIGAQLIGTDIILVMDMWEHAYIADFGLDLKKYCETYLSNVNWSVVSTLYNDSVHKKINHLFVR